MRVDLTYDGSGRVLAEKIVEVDPIQAVDEELRELDGKFSRRDEDIWVALISLGADVPAFVRGVMDRKQQLRELRKHK